MITPGRHRNQRGQALLISVLVLLVAAALGAFFVALISFNLGQVTREAEVLELRQVAEAGIEFADQQLTHSPEGADWRPRARKGRPFGRGAFDLEIVYQPNNTDPTSRFIKIISTAYYPEGSRAGSPFLKHRLIAFKPILLTDYVRFFTDRFNTGGPVSFTVPEVERNGVKQPYLVYLKGPVRANTDLIWYGSAWIYQATPLDRLEVSGSSRLAPGITPTATQQNLYNNLGSVISTYFQRDPGFWMEELPRVLPPLIDSADPDTGVRRYNALTRDSGRWFNFQNRWYNTGQLAFARDRDGKWLLGEGIYIDNIGDIQFNHTYDQLRAEWVTPQHGQGNWDQVGKVYTPPGVEIILHAEPYPEKGPYEKVLGGIPYLELIRHDTERDALGNEQPKPWRMAQENPDRSWSMPPVDEWLNSLGFRGMSELRNPNPPPPNLPDPRGQRLLLPYPRNGVIYAEGNVRVWGQLPRSVRVPTYFPSAEAGRPEESPEVRHFDLTIVSGGSIYIDGPILSPVTAATRWGLDWDPATQTDSRLALLARDNVCLNTTQAASGRLHLPPYYQPAHPNFTLAADPPSDNVYYQIPSAASLQFVYNDRGLFWDPTTTGPFANAKFFLRHAGYTGSDAAPEADKNVAVSLGLYRYPDLAASYPKWFDGFVYTFDSYTFKAPTPGWNLWDSPLFGESYMWYKLAADGPFEFPRTGTPPIPVSNLVVAPPLLTTSTDNVITFSATATPADSGYSYLLADAAVEPVKWKRDPDGKLTEPAEPALFEVDALIYAQNGSWFVLPGPWGNEDATDYDNTPSNGITLPEQADEDVPSYHEPLNLRILIRGAISENLPAQAGDLRDWASKWSGPGVGSSQPFAYFHGRHYLSYEYEPALRDVAYVDSVTGLSLPRLPRLPVSPGLILWGERV